MGYLVKARAIPLRIVAAAVAQGIPREGPFGSV
jgi:hypothetical protein